MTVIILLWLEKYQQSNKKSWKLILQKGKEWLIKFEINFKDYSFHSIIKNS